MKELLEMNKPFKKYLPIYMIMLSIVLLMGTSYALLRSSHQGENTYTMNVGTLQVIFVDSETNALTLEDAYPMTDDEGMSGTKELIFTVKNTGTVTAKYSVYIEETSTNPEFKSVIRFISNKNDTGYNSPKTLSSDKYIDSESYLGVSATAIYKVKAWIAETADSTYMNKIFTARVVVDSEQAILASEKVKDNLKNKNSDSCQTYQESDGTYYVSADDCVDFNYVWYSGKMWRIVSVNSDGTMKMMTDNNITTIAFGANHRFYDFKNNITSFAYQFLNEEFLDTLYNYQNIIVTDNTWNESTASSIDTELPTTGDDAKIINNATTGKNTPVGLLNSYDYYMSFGSDYECNGMADSFWLLNSDNYDGSAREGFVNLSCNTSESADSAVNGIRPVVSLLSSIKFTSGNGTKTNPYHISGDKEDITANTTLLNTRNSGEYVKIDNELYRISSINNNITKVIKDTYISSSGTSLTKKFSTTYKYGDGSTVDYWNYYLNNTWYNSLSVKSLITSGTFYINYVEGGQGIFIENNEIISDSLNYKDGICSAVNTTDTIKNCTKTTNTWSGNIGLPRYGEMFASLRDENTSDFYLITPFDSSKVWSISGTSSVSYNIDPSTSLSATPMFNLSASTKITGGTGLPDDPFTIG